MMYEGCWDDCWDDDCWDDEAEREDSYWTQGHCRECDDFGDVQCSIHGDIVIEQMREQDRIARLQDVLERTRAAVRRGPTTKAGRRARRRAWCVALGLGLIAGGR